VIWGVSPSRLGRKFPRKVAEGMGFKEGTHCDERWVLYANDESPNSTPETNTALYVN